MTIDRLRDGKPVPLRIVPPPVVSGVPWEMASPGERTKAGLLEPLTMRERGLVCAIASALEAFRFTAEGGEMGIGERQGVLGLLVAFEDATGCAWTEARWGEAG